MKFSHINLVARDRDRLVDFYKRVFGCEERRERWTMSGRQISKGNGVPNCEIHAAWLSLPGVAGSFLEIFQYRDFHDRPAPPVKQPGFGHICFEVENIRATCAAVIAAGGTPVGEIVDLGTPQSPVYCVYLRDPEGNVVELEQR